MFGFCRPACYSAGGSVLLGGLEGRDVCVGLKFDHSFKTKSFCGLLIMHLAT